MRQCTSPLGARSADPPPSKGRCPGIPLREVPVGMPVDTMGRVESPRCAIEDVPETAETRQVLDHDKTHRRHSWRRHLRPSHARHRPQCADRGPLQSSRCRARHGVRWGWNDCCAWYPMPERLPLHIVFAVSAHDLVDGAECQPEAVFVDELHPQAPSTSSCGQREVNKSVFH